MNWLRSLAVSAVLAATAAPALASRPPPPWYRPPLLPETFAFTGVISPTVLQDGVQVAANNNVPADWLGGTIRGTITLIPDRAEGGDGGPGTIFWTDGNPEFGRSGNWYTVSITNPDGSVFTVPGDAPAPSPMGDNSTGIFRADDGWFSPPELVQETFHTSRSFSDEAHQQAFEIDLATIVGLPPEAPNLLSYPPQQPCCVFELLQLIQVDVSAATFTNAGFVSQFVAGADGERYAYGFQLTKFVHLAPVPEPETWAMMMAGFALAGWGGLRRRGR